VSGEPPSEEKGDLIMPDLSNLLPNDQLTKLRTSFKSRPGKEQMAKILRGVLPDLYAESSDYVAAILRIYFKEQTDRDAMKKAELNESDRERCIIALLAVQGGQFTLALHIYLGLMVGVSPQEIAHVLLLSGVYGGVNRFADAMFVHVKTLTELNKLTTDKGPAAVNKALRIAFGIDPKPAAV
jgi:alkylhydroperoxidase/carboxymuconolactone decarboxylase family protein YurZ